MRPAKQILLLGGSEHANSLPRFQLQTRGPYRVVSTGPLETVSAVLCMPGYAYQRGARAAAARHGVPFAVVQGEFVTIVELLRALLTCKRGPKSCAAVPTRKEA